MGTDELIYNLDILLCFEKKLYMINVLSVIKERLLENDNNRKIIIDQQKILRTIRDVLECG